MINKEHEILGPFVKIPWKKFTFKEIKQVSKKKSGSYVYSILKKFVKNNVLNQEPVGNNILYSLNINSSKTQSYAGFLVEYITNKKSFENIEKISKKIPTSFYIIIITGSYAKNMQTKNSDLDLVIICDEIEIKKIYAELKLECELSIPKIHLYVFKKSEFLEMLKNKEANYGKEIARNNLIYSGGEIYYRIINEAIQNGFNG